jgi:FkbM family methyltransferase
VKQTVRKILHKLGLDLKRYSSSDFYKINQLLQSNQINLVLDVGANKGQYKNFLRTIGYSGKIISFEPLSEAYSHLIKVSQADQKWKIAPKMAIGDREGEIVINIAGNSQSSSILPMLKTHQEFAPESKYINTEIVKINTLDNIIPQYLNENEKSRIFLKIDVQGYEKNVLEGAKNILCDIQGIQLEMSLVPLYEGEVLFQDMVSYMNNLGYFLNYLLPGFSDKNTGRILQVDGIFFKQ